MKQCLTPLRRWAMDRDCPLIVLLLNSWAFLALAAFMMSCLILIPLSAWKIIRVTPAGMMPVIKVSALDLIQAKAFSRQALKLDPAAEPETLFELLSKAIGNCPGSIGYNRQYLDALIKHDLKRQRWSDAARTGHWLLKLSRTNQVDLERTLIAFNQYGMHDNTVELYESLPTSGGHRAEYEYLSALIEVGSLDELSIAWRQRSNEFADDPTLTLIQASLDAVSNNQTKLTSGLSLIEQASHNQDLEKQALRLRLLVAQHREDVVAFEAALNRLDGIFRISVYDHLAFWEMLAKDGRREQAVREARSFAIKPKSAREVVRVGNTYYRLGLGDLAFRYLTNYVNGYGFASAAWFTQAHILIEKRDWKALHHLARQLRASHGVSQAYVGFSHYLDAKAYTEEGHSLAAEKSAENLLNYSLADSDLGLFVASNLWELDLTESTMSVLWNERTRHHNEPVFWDLCMKAAIRLGKGRRALVASENLYRIDPDDQRTRANYAALLMSERIHLDHALALTLDAVLHYPANMDLRVNYARALTLNSRNRDAVSALEHIDMKTLTPDGLNAYRYATMELFLALGKQDDATTLADEIIPARLLPGDRVRFERTIKDWQRDKSDDIRVLTSL